MLSISLLFGSVIYFVLYGYDVLVDVVVFLKNNFYFYSIYLLLEHLTYFQVNQIQKLL